MTAPPGERPEHFRIRRDEREIPPDDLPMQVAAREGRPVIGDTLEILFADRRTKVIHGNATPLFDEDGRPRGAVGAFMDITEWRRVETALADSEGRLRLAVEATDLGLFDRDLLTGELRWSARTKVIFGLSADHPITFDRFLAMIHPEDRERIGAAIDLRWTPRSPATMTSNSDASATTARPAGCTPRAGPSSRARAPHAAPFGSSAPPRTSRHARMPRPS